MVAAIKSSAELQAPATRPAQLRIDVLDTPTSTTVIDDHSLLAYSEILTDEKKETAAEFWKRANAFFTDAGIPVTRVLTDNGACYRFNDFKQAHGSDVKHKRTRPYRPQTNGKVERFNPTMLEE